MYRAELYSRRRRSTLTERCQLVVAHPVDVHSADGAAERQRRDHRTDRLAGGVRTRVLDAPGPVDLPVDSTQTGVEHARLTDLVTVRGGVQLRLQPDIQPSSTFHSRSDRQKAKFHYASWFGSSSELAPN